MNATEPTAVPGQNGTYSDDWLSIAPDYHYPFGIGPILARTVIDSKADSSIWLALRITSQHENGMGFCHGGILMTLADEIMGINVYKKCQEKPVPTASLQVQFLSPARPGDLVEAFVTEMNITRTLAFAQASLMVRDTTIATANAIFKIIDKN